MRPCYAFPLHEDWNDFNISWTIFLNLPRCFRGWSASYEKLNGHALTAASTTFFSAEALATALLFLAAAFSCSFRCSSSTSAGHGTSSLAWLKSSHICYAIRAIHWINEYNLIMNGRVFYNRMEFACFIERVVLSSDFFFTSYKRDDVVKYNWCRSN